MRKELYSLVSIVSILWGRVFGRTKGFAWSVAIAALAAAMPMNAQADDLLAAFSSAYHYDSRLAAARARLKGTIEKLARAQSGVRPRIDGQADYAWQWQATNPDALDDGSSEPIRYSVSIVQPVSELWRARAAIEEAEAEIAAERAGLHTLEQEVFFDVARAYSGVLRDRAVVKLWLQNVDVLEDEIQAIGLRVGAGEAKQSELAQARSRKARSESGLHRARAELEASSAAYELVVGVAPIDLLPINIPASLVPNGSEEAAAVASAEHPLVLQALSRELAGSKTVRRLEGELLPDLTVEGSYQGAQDPSAAIREQESASVMGRLRVSFYDGGDLTAQVRQAKQERVALGAEVRLAQARVRSSVSTAWARMTQLRSEVRSEQKRVELAITALNAVRREAESGQRTVVDVLDFEEELLQARIALEASKHDDSVARIELVSAIGRLSAPSLEIDTSDDGIEAYYNATNWKAWGLAIDNESEIAETVDSNWDATISAEGRK